MPVIEAPYQFTIPLSLSFKQNITARLAYEKPDDPIQYVLDAIAKVKSGENVEELK